MTELTIAWSATSQYASF